MGVLNCDRNRCNKAMCDRYSHDHGYICEECFEELCGLGIVVDIAAFMATPKLGLANCATNARLYYEAEFPDVGTHKREEMEEQADRHYRTYGG